MKPDIFMPSVPRLQAPPPPPPPKPSNQLHIFCRCESCVFLPLFYENDYVRLVQHIYMDKEKMRGSDCQSSAVFVLCYLWGLGTEQEQGYRTGAPGYIGLADQIRAL